MSCRSSRDSFGSCDSAVQTVSRCLTRAKDGKTNSREFEDATVALKKIKAEREQQREETRTLRREKEQLKSRAEQAELEVGRREQGPQAAKEELMRKLVAENERLKAKMQDIEKKDGSTNTAQHNEESESSSFESYLRIYLEDSKEVMAKQNNSNEKCTHSNPAPKAAGASHFIGRQPAELSESKEEEMDPFAAVLSHYFQSDNGVMSGAAFAARHRRSKSCNARNYLQEEREAMQSAGVAAQRRRSLSRSRRNSQSSILRHGSLEDISLNNVVNVLSNTEGKTSQFTELIIRILSAAKRPVEVNRLQTMLREHPTETEFLLRYTVVGHLVTVLQC